MNINTLLASLEEFLSIKKDYLNGQQTEENYELSKKNFSQCLNEYIDAHYSNLTKEKKVITDRSRVSTASSIKVADVLAHAFDGSNMAIIALNNAPSPFKFGDDTEDNSSLTNWLNELREAQEWMKAYSQWFFLIKPEATK